MKKKYGFMLAVAVLLAGCGQKKETSVITARPVKTTIVESRSIIRKDFSGIVEAVEYVKLAFRVSGQIINLPVIEGEKVKKGQLIAAIDPRDIALQYAATKSAYETAAAQVERNKRLLSRQAISVQEYEISLSNYQKAKNIMNNSKNRHLKTLNKIPRIIFLFSIIATIISIIVLCSIPGNLETISCDYESFSNGWVTDNGSKADLSHITGKYMVHNTIPLLSHDSKLFFFLKTSNVYVYIDDELIYKPDSYTTRLLGKTPGASFVQINIDKKYSGHTVTLDIDNPYCDGSGKISDIYIGDGKDIILSHIRQKLPAFSLSLVITVFGLCFIFLFIPLYHKHMIGAEMLYLGVFATIIGLFMIMDCRIMQLFFQNAHIFHMQAEILMPLIIPPLFLFMGRMYNEYSQRIVNLITAISSISFILRFMLSLLNIKDFHETLIITHIIYGISIILVLHAVITGILRRNRNNIYHNIGCICFISAVSIDIILHWTRLSAETSFFTRIGVLLFLFLEALQIISYLLSNYQANIRMKLLSRLAYHDGLTDMLNRTSYMEEIKNISSNGYPELLVAIFDVNNLKFVNDTYGHIKGDELIKSVADCLQNNLSDLGKCYRIGGDEFVFISKDNDAENRFKEITASLSQSYGDLHIDDDTYMPITVAMGYSILRKDMKRSIDDAIREADSKMYENKRKIKDSINI